MCPVVQLDTHGRRVHGRPVHGLRASERLTPGPLDQLGHRLRPAARDAEGALVLLRARRGRERPVPADRPSRSRGDAARRGAPWTAFASARRRALVAVREIGYPDPDSFLRTYDLVARWLDAFADESGIPPERTVLGGFSQGAVMTYSLGLGAGRPHPAALVCLSGFMPTVPGFSLDLEPPLPPVAIGHGAFDPVIAVEWSRQARETLTAAGADVLYREAPVPHTIDPSFLRELRPWLRRALDPDTR